jgi:hypothetical protein
VRSITVIEAFPGLQLCVQVHIIGVSHELIKLSLIRSVGAFDFTVELRGSRLDVDMLYALVFNMPVETSLKLMSPIGSDGTDAERKLFDHIVDECNGSLLVMM